MKIFLKLYPPAWRRRYEAELAALLEDQRAGTRGAFDLIRGAADAWIIGPRGPLGGLMVWLAALAFAAASILGALIHRVAGPMSEPNDTIFQLLYWILFIVFTTFLSDQPAARCDLGRLLSRLRR